MSAAPLLFFYRLQQARQKDENTIRLVGHFSAKYGYVKVKSLHAGFLIYIDVHLQSIKSSEKKEKHLFTINCGGQRQTHERGSCAD